MFILITIIILILSIIADISYENNYFTSILLLSLTTSIVITRLSIPLLKKLKFKQIIRKEGPKKHYPKLGTPTMGAVLIVPAGLIIGNLINLSSENYNEILGVTFISFAYLIIGFFNQNFSLIVLFLIGYVIYKKFEKGGIVKK